MSDSPIYSQRDPLWAGLHYGLAQAAPESTIGAYGCGITALAQKLTLHGKPTMPNEVQDALAEAKGYKAFGSFNFVNWALVPTVYKHLQYNGRWDYFNPTPMPDRIMQMIDDRLRMVDPVIVYVDASPYTAGLQQHFVLVVEREQSGNLIILNPWNGKRHDLRAYGPTDPLAIRGVVLLDWIR